MSSIVTFYSYKGGVGRSMALANIAVLLARRGLRVLTVDWDLEAPGLERYFTSFENTAGGLGLLRMCMDVRDSVCVDYREYASFVDCEAKYPITILTSGREGNAGYSGNLEKFDWEDFFSKGGGAFLEDLRQQWRKEYDIVLIDSRTGLSDSGGICTILLPDVVVAMFSANYQSLYGVRDVMRLAQKARQNLAYDRMPLSILPLPARWGMHEFHESRAWLERIAEALEEFYTDWLPITTSARQVVELVKVPQTDFFGFGERLAVVEQGVADPQGMGFVYEKVAAFLAADFMEIGALLGNPTQGSSKSSSSITQTHPLTDNDGADYLYDVFVSYDASSSEWVFGFVELLKQHLPNIRFFLALQELRAAQSWDTSIETALLRSKTMIALVTPQYLSNPRSMRELATFERRSTDVMVSTWFALLLQSIGTAPDRLFGAPLVDFRANANDLSSSRNPSAMQQDVFAVAERLNELIASAPAYNLLSRLAATEDEGVRIIEVLQHSSKRDRVRRILWVDDRPSNNIYARRKMEKLQISFVLARSTEEALALLKTEEFGLIISDMGRAEGPREGYLLLTRLRNERNQTPFIIYAGSNENLHKQEALVLGAQGSTNDLDELIRLVDQHLKT